MERSRVLAAASLLALACPIEPALAQVLEPTGPIIVPISRCRLIPNGSFSNGFDQWTVTPTTAFYGDAGAGANATIEDITGSGGDTKAACLSIGAGAGWTCDFPSGSSATAQVELSTTATVSGRYLRYCLVGGFETILFAQGRACYDALVVISTSDGRMVKCPRVDFCFNTNFECEAGIAAIGAFLYECQCCDLAAGGIVVGDVVTIKVIWSTAVTASNECDIAEFGGTLCVDQFQFCTLCPLIINPGIPIDAVEQIPLEAGMLPLPADRPARLEAMMARARERAAKGADLDAQQHDVNGDGAVDQEDANHLAGLLKLGVTDAAEGDVNRDGRFDALDIVEVLKRIK